MTHLTVGDWAKITISWIVIIVMILGVWNHYRKEEE